MVRSGTQLMRLGDCESSQYQGVLWRPRGAESETDMLDVHMLSGNTVFPISP